MAETTANGMHGIRKRYVDLKLSSNVVELIMNFGQKVLRNNAHHILPDGLIIVQGTI